VLVFGLCSLYLHFCCLFKFAILQVSGAFLKLFNEPAVSEGEFNVDCPKFVKIYLFICLEELSPYVEIYCRGKMVFKVLYFGLLLLASL
jgi:hypothetical protein